METETNIFSAVVNKVLAGKPLRSSELLERLHDENVSARDADRIPKKIQRGQYPGVWVATKGGQPLARGSIVYYYREGDPLPKDFSPAPSVGIDVSRWSARAAVKMALEELTRGPPYLPVQTRDRDIRERLADVDRELMAIPTIVPPELLIPMDWLKKRGLPESDIVVRLRKIESVLESLPSV